MICFYCKENLCRCNFPVIGSVCERCTEVKEQVKKAFAARDPEILEKRKREEQEVVYEAVELKTIKII
jgi:hypothetical protein